MTTLESRGIKLLAACDDLTYSTGHGEAWKNKVARDLNHMLGRAQYFLETSCDESDIAAACSTLRVVRRVAEFEGIRRK